MKCLISAVLSADEPIQGELWSFRKAGVVGIQKPNRLLNTNNSTASKILLLWGPQETFISVLASGDPCFSEELLVVRPCGHSKSLYRSWLWQDFTIKCVVHFSQCDSASWLFCLHINATSGCSHCTFMHHIPNPFFFNLTDYFLFVYIFWEKNTTRI